jgi:DNA-binding NarL/FixJ family response regulator
MFRELQPDVVQMDPRMRADGIDTTRTIRAEFPDASRADEWRRRPDIYRALDAGMRGYLLKETAHAEVVHAIRTVHAGRRLMPPDVAERLSEYFPQVALTIRETEVLKLVSEGLGNKEIADRLGTASGTVKMHVQNILDKLGAVDRTHAVTMAIRRGILHLT